MNSAETPIDNFLRAIIDFFIHPGRSAGGGIVFVITVLVVIFAIAIVIFVVGIVFTYIRIWEHNRMVKKRDAAKLLKISEEKKVMNPRWKKVSDLASSGNESAYRIAIIDADSMLDDLLTGWGIVGDTVHEKLKRARTMGGFNTIDMAFEAHSIRNAIAHSGPDFKISEREARRVIGLFEKVFQEQGII